MIAIPLTQGQVTLVDDADEPLVSAYTWRAHRGSRGGEHWYAATGDGGRHLRKFLYLHRLLLPGVPFVDHRNGDGLDNRRENLRPATCSQNLANVSSRGGFSSAFKGVWWERRRQRWYASICVNQKRRFLGYFNDEIDAAIAYNEAATNIWGDYARLNSLTETHHE